MCIGHGLSEILILAVIDEGIVTRDSCFERRGGHRLLLIFADNFRGEFAQRVSAEKPAVGIDERRGDCPIFAFHGVRVKDGPDRPASLALRRRLDPGTDSTSQILSQIRSRNGGQTD